MISKYKLNLNISNFFDISTIKAREESGIKTAIMIKAKNNQGKTAG